MKKMVIICVVSLMSIIMSSCSSNNTVSVPPIYYDYGYTFNERIRGERFRGGIPCSDYRSDEHKHEYVKFDYRTR